YKTTAAGVGDPSYRAHRAGPSQHASNLAPVVTADRTFMGREVSRVAESGRPARGVPVSRALRVKRERAEGGPGRSLAARRALYSQSDDLERGRTGMGPARSSRWEVAHGARAFGRDACMPKVPRRDFMAAAGLAAVPLIGPKPAAAGDPSFLNNVP